MKKFKKKIGRDAFGNKCILKTPAVLKDKCKTVKVRSFKKITADNGNVFTTVWREQSSGRALDMEIVVSAQSLGMDLLSRFCALTVILLRDF